MPKKPNPSAAAPKASKKPRRATPLQVQTRKAAPCVVCGAEVAPFSTEDLCWVCRRLKISAWRDVEGQAAMQE